MRITTIRDEKEYDNLNRSSAFMLMIGMFSLGVYTAVTIMNGFMAWYWYLLSVACGIWMYVFMKDMKRLKEVRTI